MYLGHLLFSFHGRVSRKIWWLTQIAVWLSSLITFWLYHKVGLHDAISGSCFLKYLSSDGVLDLLCLASKKGWRNHHACLLRDSGFLEHQATPRHQPIRLSEIFRLYRAGRHFPKKRGLTPQSVLWR